MESSSGSTEKSSVKYSSRDEFLAGRQGKIGSSDVSAILGINKYRTPLQVYMEKKGLSDGQVENDYMKLGTLMEPVIAEMVRLKHPEWHIEKADKTYYNDKYPWACASPDYFLWIDGRQHILEIKNVSEYLRDEWEETPTSIADHAHVQALYQGEMCALPVKVAALIGGRDLVIRDVEQSPLLVGTIMSSCEAFFDYLQNDLPPLARDADEDLLMAINGFDPTSVIEDRTDEARELIARYVATSAVKRKIDAEAKKLKEEKEDLEMAIRQRMGAHAILVTDRFRATVKKVPRAGYTVEPTSYYTFSVKEAL